VAVTAFTENHPPRLGEDVGRRASATKVAHDLPRRELAVAADRREDLGDSGRPGGDVGGLDRVESGGVGRLDPVAVGRQPSDGLEPLAWKMPCKALHAVTAWSATIPGLFATNSHPPRIAASQSEAGATP
jgi:hypothetical protein